MKFIRVLVLTSLTSAALMSLRAAEESPNRTFFLPKSPVAATYVLGRLSNKELIKAPRSEFVYVALLERKGLERKYRFEALDGLAKIRGTDPLTELLTGLADLDKKGDVSEPVLRDLSPILLQTNPQSLAAKRSVLEKLAAESQLPLTRHISFAAIVTGDANIDREWAEAHSNPKQLVDLLLAIELIRESSLRAAIYPKVEPLVHETGPVEVRRAAITALAAISGHDLETFNTLAALVKAGTERATAIAGLERIPRANWPKELAEPLSESLVQYLQSVPLEQRTDPDMVSAFQFATDLAALLSPDKAAALGKTLRALGVSVFVVRTVPEQMLFDKTLIVVQAGKPVQIILRNEDAMPHNLVVVAPGAVEEVGMAAEKMPPVPDTDGRLYIPDSPKVLHATRLVDPGQEAKLNFTAPTEPGDYHYVCTFPGHWRRMVGTLAVVNDVEAYLATHAASTQPKLTQWTIEDLAPQLAKAGVGHDLTHGRELFAKLACVSCHRLGSEGVSYGPDLSDVFQRYHNDPAAVLQQILEPSLVISNRYRNFEFELKNDEPVTGMIVKQDAESVTVQTGPSASLIQTLKRSDITSQKMKDTSPMPVGLLNLMSKEDIFDLLAWLEKDGRGAGIEHQH